MVQTALVPAYREQSCPYYLRQILKLLIVKHTEEVVKVEVKEVFVV